jgi:excisionase family DNA binding protein
MATKDLGIKEAAKWLGLSEVYIRRLISQNKLETYKVSVSDGVWKHMIPEAELNRLNSKHSSTRTMREDGRNKYTVYATEAELAKLQMITKEAKLGIIIERANKPEEAKKRYLAQKAKKALKKQESK